MVDQDRRARRSGGPSSSHDGQVRSIFFSGTSTFSLNSKVQKLLFCQRLAACREQKEWISWR